MAAALASLGRACSAHPSERASAAASAAARAGLATAVASAMGPASVIAAVPMMASAKLALAFVWAAAEAKEGTATGTATALASEPGPAGRRRLSGCDSGCGDSGYDCGYGYGCGHGGRGPFCGGRCDRRHCGSDRSAASAPASGSLCRRNHGECRGGGPPWQPFGRTSTKSARLWTITRSANAHKVSVAREHKLGFAKDHAMLQPDKTNTIVPRSARSSLA